MSIFLMVTDLSLSTYPAVFPQYSQNHLNMLSSVVPIVGKAEALDWGYNSTFRNFNIEQSNAVYDVLESNVEHEDDDYSDDTQLQSFAKSTFQVQIKVKKIKKIVNFI